MWCTNPSSHSRFSHLLFICVILVQETRRVQEAEQVKKRQWYRQCTTGTVCQSDKQQKHKHIPDTKSDAGIW